MRRIWKFPLKITDEQLTPMPVGARLLTAQVQNGTLCVWALVDPEKEIAASKFRVVGTGNPLPAELGRYISSVQDGPFVWHVFADH